MAIVRVAEDVESGGVVVGAGGGGGAVVEVTEPLLRQSRGEENNKAAESKIPDEEAGCGDANGAGGSLRMVLLSTAVAICGSFEFGTCVGYSAPTQSGIVDDVRLSIPEVCNCNMNTFAIFGSILTIGAMIGAVTSGRLADFLGRKMTMRISAIICIFGWLSIHLAKSAIMLYFGRILLGFSTGVLSYVVPVFIAEIAPKNLRGGLATSNQLLICSGSSATYIIGALVGWRNLVLVGLVPCVLLLAGLFFIPESPRWLANVGREKEFHTALQNLRGESADISEEAIEIKVGVGLMVFQQLGGINGVGFYASYIFTSAGFSGKLGTILIGIIQV
ncbi:hypothetical protein PR202_gb19970 [Eleusine coracana subsp. coracana]|uniref:Major facilitator superfamily (MFS) profile domain-containing protein n=1 Tax=Eleusine coracana subsp. coracana TaxID=191504 RepID=A0AAV5F7C2_ELECO|nr:hypothetical protein PR202_gb19970 [Eleusine coracana subsp. coracana]